MESTLSVSTTSLTLFTITRALNRHFTAKPPPSSSFLLTRRLASVSSARHASPFSSSSSSSQFKTLYAVLPLLKRRAYCVSTSAASFGGGGLGGDGTGGGGGGGGGGGSDGGDSKSNLVTGGAEEVSALSSNVIILDVGGMTCGGCAASVKRILESQPQVSSVSVNLTTETAIVWPIAEAKSVPNWQKELGEELAKHLTNCGFKSNLRVAGQGAIEGDSTP